MYNKLYVSLSTLSISLTFIKMLQHFTFSKKLSAFQEIMFSSAFDLLFFCLLWAQMLFGFSVSFFSCYGLELPQFKQISYSFLNSFKMSVNEFAFDEMYNVDSSFTVPIFMVFMVTYRILLQNMFIAIISAHYFQY